METIVKVLVGMVVGAAISLAVNAGVFDEAGEYQQSKTAWIGK